MKVFLRIGCAVGLLLIAVGGLPLSAMEGDSKEAKPEARIAKEKAARERFEATARANLLARQKKAEQRDQEQLEEKTVASQSSSSGTSSAVLSEESESVLPTPYARQQVRGLDDEEAQVESKEEKLVAPVEMKVSKKVEERLTVIIKADDATDDQPASEAKVALAWLLQLQPIATTFDEQHKNDAKTYQGDKSVCDYSQGDDKVERIAGCPVCDTVAQAWLGDIQNKKQLAIMVYALRTAYEKQNSETPRDIAKRLFDRLAVRAHTENPYTEADLKNLWYIAHKLNFSLFTTALVNQARQMIGEIPEEQGEQGADTLTRFWQWAIGTKSPEKIIQEKHNLAKPLFEQMKFEKFYAEGKAPGLSASMLQAYSFLPMQAAPTVDVIWQMMGKMSQLIKFLSQLPAGDFKTEISKYAAEAYARFLASAPDFVEQYKKLPAGRMPGDMRSLVLEEMDKFAKERVEGKSFDKVAFDKIPEGHFKFLVRRAYRAKRHNNIDRVDIVRLNIGLGMAADTLPRVWLIAAEVSDAACLPGELYLLNEVHAIQELHLMNHVFKHLPADLLRYCTELRIIWIAICQLQTLPVNFFRYNTKLREVSLVRNRLTCLPKDIFRYNLQLKHVALSDNPWTIERPDALVKELKKRGVIVVYY